MADDDTTLVEKYAEVSPYTLTLDRNFEEVASDGFSAVLPNSEALETLNNSYPMGRNGAPLKINFFQRQKYRNANYFDISSNPLPTPLDMLYDKVFYGKVDRFQNVIIPKQDSSLLKHASTKENVVAFNFVADAFFLLKRNLKIAGDSGGIETIQTNLFQIEASRGWRNQTSTYTAFFNDYCVMFQTDYLDNLSKKDYNNIITFSDYVGAFMNFLLTGDIPSRPITLTAYVLSPLASPVHLSGLGIEIDRLGYGDDLMKYTAYLQDVNFSYYVKAARKFGFYVDRNGPWRLMADPLSPPMVQLRSTYPNSNEDFFDTYYDRTYTLDIDLLKENLLATYNNFALGNPRVIEADIGTVACPTTRFKEIATREQVSLEYINNLGNEFWFNVYLRIRMWESSVLYKNASVLVKEAAKIARVYGDDRGVIYINNLFKPYLYDERIFNTLTRQTGTVTVGSVLDGSTVVVGSGGSSTY
jgi:hypothetical protein